MIVNRLLSYTYLIYVCAFVFCTFIATCLHSVYYYCNMKGLIVGYYIKVSICSHVNNIKALWTQEFLNGMHKILGKILSFN